MGEIETKTHHRDSTEADPLWSSLAQYFEATVSRYPNHDALIFDDARHTYTSLNDAANQVAKALAAQGITKGDHVGILMANCPTYVECLFGVAKLGAVAVLVNARYKPAELAYIIENADLKLLITHDLISEYANFGDLILEALTIRQTPLLKQLVMQGNPRDGFLPWDAFIAGGASVAQDVISALTHATTAFH
ncbi:MAG: AMP-binding protein, partial [Pseudomonadales bacterium]